MHDAVPGACPLPAGEDAIGRRDASEKPARRNRGEKAVIRQVTIAGRPFVCAATRLCARCARLTQSRCARLTQSRSRGHFVVVGTRRFPRKQVVGELTGLDRADFTTHQARRPLIRLGFSAGRRIAGTSNPRSTVVYGPGMVADPLALRLRDSSENGSRSRMTMSSTRAILRTSWSDGLAGTGRRRTACFACPTMSLLRPVSRLCEVQLSRATRPGQRHASGAADRRRRR